MRIPHPPFDLARPARTQEATNKLRVRDASNHAMAHNELKSLALNIFRVQQNITVAAIYLGVA